MKIFFKLIMIMFLLQNSLFAQEDTLIKIDAKIVDKSNKPIAFATVYSKIQKKGTISRADGNFTIKTFIDDTLECSALSYFKKIVLVSEILQGESVVIMKNKTYQIGNVDVMALRWHSFKHEVMEAKAKSKSSNALQVPGLPDIHKEKVELSPYAGMTNPVSLIMVYFSRQNKNKRRQARWRQTYKKSLASKQDTSALLALSLRDVDTTGSLDLKQTEKP